MKKRIVSIIVVMILLVSMLSGCGLITLNAERDGAQTISTVKVGDMDGVVTKAELMGFFNQLGYLYIQYYGWTPEKVINEFVTQLSNKEILVLCAMQELAGDNQEVLAAMTKANNDYVANQKRAGYKDYDAELRPYDLFNLFDYDEQFYVIKQTKKSLEESFKQLVQEVTDEHAANAEEEEEDKEEEKPEEEKKDKLEPRTQRTLTPVTKFEKDPSITKETVEAEKTFFEDMQKKIDDKQLTAIEVEAYNKMVTRLEKNYDSVVIAWNNMLDSQKEARLLEKFKDMKTKDKIVDDTEFINRYNFTITNDLSTVFDKASYKTAIEADKENKLLVHNNETGYFTVKSILLKFDEKQTKAMEAIKSGVLSDTDDKQAIYDLREKVALDESFGVVGVGDNLGGIKVNVSNPNYDPKAVCKDKDCTCPACTNNPNHKKDAVCDKNGTEKCPCVACPNNAYDRFDEAYTTIIGEMSTAIAKAGDLNFAPKADGTEFTDKEKQDARVNARMDAFDDFIYLVNDDPGMFNSTGYIMNDKGESQYVAEYVTLARELAKKAKADNAIGVVGGLVGKTGEIRVPNAINDKDPEIVIHAIKTEGGDEINYIVNDFGIHIVMVTYVAGADSANTIKIDDNTYRLGYEYVVQHKNVYVTDDEGRVVLTDGKKTLKAVENKTVKQVLSDSILDTKKADAYSDIEKKISEDNKSNIKKNDKLIKSVISEIDKALGDAGQHNHEGHNH